MANPKRKISRSQRGKRRAHQAVSAPGTIECRQCHQPKLPHRVCECGSYRGREVVAEQTKGS